ncbi:hypothetical protein [Mycobacterium sp. TY815]|uniref:hypothetical protein n=1 Tax=Mycobacterium sp. TY815 TaxID=3050581 RepID=UPI002741F6FF|nr:hypothetical protein [Mycobacterium sp. TY815]MDP7707452.1 hypothetical protein [Mycobacterium sp. TY815]
MTHTLIRIQGEQEGDITVFHACTSTTRMAVTWGGILMTFWSTQAVQSVLEAFAAARALTAPLMRRIPAPPTPPLEPFAVQTIALDWTRGVSYAVLAREELARDRTRTLRWIDLHCGPCTWQILDQEGYASALELLRRAHRTAVHVFADGSTHSDDPTLDDYRPRQ